MDETEQMRLLGQRIRQAREQLGLSQEELAHQWGKKQYQVSEYENGKRRIYAHDLPDLAHVLHVNISYFFSSAQGSENKSNMLSDSEDTILQIFRDLPSKSAQEFAVKFLIEFYKVMQSNS